jgi:nucleoside-diphosphate-sugar epimerase
MRVLVTGGAGFVGSHLTERLLSDGHEVVGVDCMTDYYAPQVKLHNLATARTYAAFRFVDADLVTADIQEMLDSVGAVFHLAGQPGVRLSWAGSFTEYAERNGAVVGDPLVIEWLPDAAGDVTVTSASSERLRAATGWRPKVNLAEGIRRQVAWHMHMRSATRRAALRMI